MAPASVCQQMQHGGSAPTVGGVQPSNNTHLEHASNQVHHRRLVPHHREQRVAGGAAQGLLHRGDALSQQLPCRVGAALHHEVERQPQVLLPRAARRVRRTRRKAAGRPATPGLGGEARAAGGPPASQGVRRGQAGGFSSWLVQADHSSRGCALVQVLNQSHVRPGCPVPHLSTKVLRLRAFGGARTTQRGARVTPKVDASPRAREVARRALQDSTIATVKRWTY